MWMSDLNPAVASDLSSLGVHVGNSNAEVVRQCNVLVVATKPDQVCPALQRERVHIAERNLLVVSVAAGLTLTTLEAALLPKSRVVRVMPNTPALVGSGATGFAMGGAATDHDAQVVAAIFNSIGKGEEQQRGPMHRASRSGGARLVRLCFVAQIAPCVHLSPCV